MEQVIAVGMCQSPVSMYTVLWIGAVFLLTIRLLAKLLMPANRARLPPGPTPVPFFGNLLMFRGRSSRLHDYWMELSKKYGDPMTLFVGNKPCVLVSNYELTKEIFQQNIFNSRQDSPTMELMLHGGQDIAMSKYGPIWQFHKKTASRCMKPIIEGEVLVERVTWAIDFAIEQMMEREGNVQPAIFMRNAVYNIIGSVAFGKTYTVDDPDFLRLQRLVEIGNEEFINMVALDLLPFARYLPLKMFSAVRKTTRAADELKAYVDTQIDEHRRTYDPDHLRDFCDAMFREFELSQTEARDETERLTEEQMRWIIFDFFNAGTDTTSVVLTWIVLFLVIHQDVQEDCYNAIKEVIGDREPSLSDRSSLPIIDACIFETLRLRPPAPMGFGMPMPHAAVSDAKIGDYHIPKDTMIMANFHAIHTDPKHWKNPLDFDPRLHFIGEDGLIKKPTSFMPFGLGRRSCLGEQLARKELFLAIARLLQKVKLESIVGELYTDPDCDLWVAAKSFSVRVISRD